MTKTKPALLMSDQGTHAVALDIATGMIRVSVRGFVTPDKMDADLAELWLLVASVRDRLKPVRVLVDARQAPIQSAESAERLRIGTEESYRLGDRVAVIVSSMLSKMQLRRVLDDRTHQLFLTETAALKWLAGSN